MLPKSPMPNDQENPIRMIHSERKKELLQLLNDQRIQAALRLARDSGLSARQSDTLEMLAQQHQTAETDFLENLISIEERSRLQARAVKGLRLLFQDKPVPSAESWKKSPYPWIISALLLAGLVSWWWFMAPSQTPDGTININRVTTYGKDSDIDIRSQTIKEFTEEDEPKDTLRN